MTKSISSPQLYLIFSLAFTSLMQPFAAPAQTNAPAPLPPAAEEALSKGIIAAKVPDFPLAIRFFEDARKIAPEAPVIFLNLGIAESKMPGRELRAVAWFCAYLAATPDAPNAGAVKEQIAVLEVKSQSNVLRLIKVAQDAAGQIREDPPPPTSMARDKAYISQSVSMLWLAAGDTARALKAAEVIQTANWKDSALESIAGAQIRAGDIADASRTAGRIQSKDQRNKVRKAIIDAAVKTEPESQPVVEVRDWLEKLATPTARPNHWNTGRSLNTELFLDFDGYLKSLPPPSAGLHAHFWALDETAGKIIAAQKEIGRTLKAQFGK